MKNYPKEYFTLVQEKADIRDKAFQTKQLTYFQDAMVRFRNNKYNFIASLILLTLILLSIFVPLLTDESLYTETNSKLITLPPRVPLIEKLGILDGTKVFDDQPIDYETIDPETGLGYPTGGFLPEYIDFDTLTNYTETGTSKNAQYLGGTNQIFVDANKNRYSIVSEEMLSFNETSELAIDIVEFGGTAELFIYHSTMNGTELAADYYADDDVDEETPLRHTWDELTLLGSTTADGVYTIDLSELDLDSGYIVLSLVLPSVSTTGSEFVTLESITHTYTSNGEEQVEEYSGYPLATFELFGLDLDLENGRYNRKDAVRTLSSFTYDVYGAVLADSYAIIGSEEYNEILETNPGMLETAVDNEEGEGWTFGEGFPLSEVVKVDAITIAGIEYANYHVMKDGKFELGLEEEPYFLFGTDTLGQDLFALIWLGLRTSLLLGFVATLTNTFLGVIWGAISAYYGGQVDILMERFTDIWGSFPHITMIGIITSIIGTGFWALYVFLVYDGWIGASRVTRMQFYRFKNREYVLAARTLGASDRRIIFKHILPNALGTIVTRVILNIPSVIFLELNLSYLGFGLGTGQTIPFGPIELSGTSIGIILKNGTSQIFVGNLWMIIFPTIIVSILMITFNMFGNALRDALNPQLRGN